MVAVLVRLIAALARPSVLELLGVALIIFAVAVIAGWPWAVLAAGLLLLLVAAAVEARQPRGDG
jgi:hypothetical protein